MPEIGKNIKYLRENRKISRAVAARSAGISYDYLAKIENGWRSPNVGVLGRIAEAIGATLEEVLSEFQPPISGLGAFPLEESGLISLGEGRPAPLIGWARAGQWDEASDSGFEPGDADVWLYSEHGGGRTFALRVEGDSMEPEFTEGEHILVDPDRKAENGDYVIAKLENENEATFKQLKYLKGAPVLHPLNPEYTNIPIGPDTPFSIVGVVVEKKTMFGDPDERDIKLRIIIKRIENLDTNNLDRVIKALDLLYY